MLVARGVGVGCTEGRVGLGVVDCGYIGVYDIVVLIASSGGVGCAEGRIGVVRDWGADGEEGREGKCGHREGSGWVKSESVGNEGSETELGDEEWV